MGSRHHPRPMASQVPPALSSQGWVLEEPPMPHIERPAGCTKERQACAPSCVEKRRGQLALNRSATCGACPPPTGWPTPTLSPYRNWCRSLRVHALLHLLQAHKSLDLALGPGAYMPSPATSITPRCVSCAHHPCHYPVSAPADAPGDSTTFTAHPCPQIIESVTTRTQPRFTFAYNP